MPRLEDALELYELGFNVVPAAGKSPIGSWKRWSKENLPEREVRQAFARGDHNIFAITGAVSGVCVLDCDTKEAVDWWRKKLGAKALDTTRVKTTNGYHFYWKLTKPQMKAGYRGHDGGKLGEGPEFKWTFRCEGGGVIAPPSVHPDSGATYRWVSGAGPEEMRPAPEKVFEREKVEGEAASGRSILSHLLANPPQSEGGRNDWLTAVAGHYAASFRFRDAYEIHVRQAVELVGGEPPLTETEIAKLVESIWSSEQAKVPEVEDEEGEAWRMPLLSAVEETGWLVSGKDKILAQTHTKGEGTGMETWMDADIRVEGVIESERGRFYEVDLLYRDGGTRHDTLPATVVADRRQLNIWLANRACGIGTPDNIWPRRLSDTERLRRYLDAQEAIEMEGTECLGWHKESKGFITHEGVIRASGSSAHERVRPDAITREWAPYRYGNKPTGEALDVLRNVLTYHHERVAAVFGAWWAACFLKPQIMDLTSQFPFMALEAPSESGKTAGYFALMLQLCGNTGGHTIPTRAALRDYLAAHNNGIVWVDDLDTLDSIEELLRAVTTGEAVVKKGQDHREQASTRMRSALVVSGENLGLTGQKALLDRAVRLDVPSPIGRQSFNGDYPQWDDIVDFRLRHDLPEYAGALVQRALAQEDALRDFGHFRRGASRRHADKIGIVRLGARVLEGMIEDETGWVTKEVDGWAGTTWDPGSENALSLQVVPTVLRMSGNRDKPWGPENGRPSTPALNNEDGVWVDLTSAAEWWAIHQRNLGKKASQRTASAEALEQQARALDMGGPKGGGTSARRIFKFVTGDGRRVFWRFPDLIAEVIRERLEGEENGNGHG